MERSVSILATISTLLLLAQTVSAQRDRDTYNPNNQLFEVSGQVNLSGTKQALGDVPVRLERFSGGVMDQMTTDSRGRFRFPNLQRAYYRVIINAPGYNPVQQDADLTVLSRAYLVFELTVNRESGNEGPRITGVVDARVPADAQAEFTQGRSAIEKKNYPDAISHLQKATSLYPSYFEAYLLLATALMENREWDKAETHFNRALEIKPENPEAMISLGEVYWRQKRLKDAEEILLAALKLDEKAWRGHFTLSRVYLDLNEIIKAGRSVGMTLQLKPDFAEAHLVAGNVLLKIDQPQRALQEYEEYLRLAPKGEFAPKTRELVQQLRKN